MTTKKKAQSPDPEIVSELRELLQPEKISHESARNGSILLAGLEDKKLYAIFKKVCLDKSGNFYAIIKETFGNEFQEGFDDKSLTDALRRLSLVGESLAVKIRNSKAKKAKKPKIPVVNLDLNPGLKLNAHILAAKKAEKNMDCVQKMAGLASLLSDQLETLYTYPTREAQPFMGVKQVNMVAQTYMNTLAQLHKMQMDVGIVEKTPEKMEVNMRQQGAFQTYIGELSPEHKESMIEFADTFCKFVERKIISDGRKTE